MTVGQFRAPCLTALLAGCVSTAAPAQAQELGFNLPAQDLSSALNSYAKQAGVQILFPTDAIRGRRSAALQGKMTRQTALRLLIAGAGLRIVSDAGSTVVLGKGTAQASASSGATDPEADAASEQDEIVVTGSGRAQRKFDVSYAVTTLDRDEIKKLAPLNFADLLGQVPGIYVESTGGEVQNVFRVRGIPDSQSFQAFQQDGMPVFQDNDGVYFKSDTLNRIDLMTSNIEFVRGARRRSSRATPRRSTTRSRCVGATRRKARCR